MAAPQRPGRRGVVLLVLSAATLGVLTAVGLERMTLSQADLIFSLAAIALLALGYAADRLGRRRVSLGVTVFLFALAGASIWVNSENRLRALFVKGQTKAWNIFHYVLGTKYFDELGYFDLYKAALLADEEGSRYFQTVRLTRDMRTYKEIPRERAIEEARAEGVRERFTDARWAEFKRDLAQIQRHAGRGEWSNALRDLGFNPSPAWLIVHKPLLNRLDVSRRGTLVVLCFADLLFYALLIALGWWAFGARAAALGTLWTNAFFGNWNLLVGSYFHYDWLFFAVAAVILYGRRRPVLAALCLSYTAMMRGFPGLLAIHPALTWLADAVRLRRPPAHRTIFLAVLAAACLAQVALAGAVTGRGLSVWLEWREKITIHARNHPLFSKRIGLVKLFTHDYQTGRWQMPKDRRVQVIERNRLAYQIARWTLVLLTLLAMLRRGDHDGMLLGMVCVFALLLVSRYYASLWALFFTWTTMDRRGIVNLASSMWLFVALAIYYWLELRRDNYWFIYYVFNAGMTLYFLALVLHFLARDVRWLRELGKDHTVPAPSPI